MEYLIAVDLEGIGGVVGLPNETLTGSPDYALSIENATKEINTVVRALFDNGATKVAVWDNHGKGHNLDFSKIDERAVKVCSSNYPYRLDFAQDFNFAGIIYLGYHAREGTFGGILAHTYSSVAVQYVKIDGKPVGELEIDTYIAGTHGIAPLLTASDKACVDQFALTATDTEFVTTKYGISRNEATLRDEEEILAELYDATVTAMKKDIKPITYPTPLTLEVRFTRAELAAQKLELARIDDGISDARYGEDTHTVFFTIEKINRIVKVVC